VTNSGRLTECRPTPDWSDDGIVLLVDHATLLEADGRLVLIARLTTLSPQGDSPRRTTWS
jgi:hypothetical protein